MHKSYGSLMITKLYLPEVLTNSYIYIVTYFTKLVTTSWTDSLSWYLKNQFFNCSRSRYMLNRLKRSFHTCATISSYHIENIINTIYKMGHYLLDTQYIVCPRRLYVYKLHEDAKTSWTHSTSMRKG